MEALILILVFVLSMAGLALRDRAELEKSVEKMALASTILICTIFSAFAWQNLVSGHAGSLNGLITITCFATFIFVMGLVQSLKWIRKTSD